MLFNWLNLAPMIITAVTVVVVMLTITVKRCAIVTASLSFLGLLIAFLSVLCCASIAPPSHAVSTLNVDNFSLFYMGLILLSTMACVIFSYSYFKNYSDDADEFYILMLLSAIGALILVSADHFASFFIGLELLSVPIYGMLAYTRERKKSLEAGLKYLILSATASATLLFGMALLYAQFGTMEFSKIGANVQSGISTNYLLIASVMIIVAVSFKLSIAPFHQWAPDVYQASPVPAATFLATVSKAAVFAVALRFLLETGLLESMPKLVTVLSILAIASMLLGNLLAFKQNNYLRILGLSSVSHMGYLMVGVLSLAGAVVNFHMAVVNFYMAVYVITSIGAFGVINFVNSPYQERHNNGDYKFFEGLFWRHPWIAATMTVMFLSLVGVPLTAGFMGKLFIVFEALAQSHWLLVAILIIGSAISIYYYLRSILNLYARDKYRKRHPEKVGFRLDAILLVMMLLMILFIGVSPQSLLAISDLTLPFPN